MIDAVVDLVESELVVPLAHIRHHGDGLAQHVLIEGVHLSKGTASRLRIEVVEIARARSGTSCCESCDSSPRRAASAASEPTTSSRKSTEATHRRTISPPRRLADVDGIDIVAARLRHGLTFFVERPAGRDDAFVGRSCHVYPWRRAGKTETIRGTGRRLRGRDRRARDSRARRRSQQPDSWRRIRARRRRCRFLSRILCRRSADTSCRREESCRPRACTRRRRRTCAKSSTTLRLTAGSLSGLPQLRTEKTAMGTPQTRWREMHQSGRVCDHVGDALFAPGRVPFHFLDFFESAGAQGVVPAGRRAWAFPWR